MILTGPLGKQFRIDRAIQLFYARFPAVVTLDEYEMILTRPVPKQFRID